MTMSQPLRELLIIRHAKSDWSDETLPDIERPLSEKGKKQACKIGNWLQEQGLLPDLILVSPATRAQQTLSRLMRHWESKPPSETLNSLYNADLETLFQALQQVPSQAGRVAIIGHNPGLEQLLAWLTGTKENSDLSTCAVAHLIMPTDWKTLHEGVAKRTQLITPKDV